MIDYNDFSPNEKVAYLEDRLAQVNKINQSAIDTMLAVAKDLSLLALKLDMKGRELREHSAPSNGK